MSKRNSVCSGSITATKPDTANNALETMPDGSLTSSSFQKLAFFERIFYEIDDNQSGNLDRGEFDSFMSYAMPHVPPSSRAQAFNKAAFAADSRLTRLEFLEICAEVLWSVPLDQLKVASENLMLARNQAKMKHKRKWQKLASAVDSWCVLIVPPVYATVMLILFNIELADTYLDDASAPMFSGMAPLIGMAASGVAACLIPAM
eukprot:6387358-Prymnesium_polylepis.1